MNAENKRREINAKIMDPRYGNLGLYTACFIDQVLNQGLLDRQIERITDFQPRSFGSRSDHIRKQQLIGNLLH